MGYRQYDIFQDFYLSKSVKSGFFIRKSKMLGKIFSSIIELLAYNTFHVMVTLLLRNAQNYYACMI